MDLKQNRADFLSVNIFLPKQTPFLLDLSVLNNTHPSYELQTTRMPAQQSPGKEGNRRTTTLPAQCEQRSHCNKDNDARMTLFDGKTVPIPSFKFSRRSITPNFG
jgi:hypothetical protein